ncbi:MAG: alkaline phosphatase family protein [Chitinophagaceae bacterium]|nr:alkaline phosphatase family protein [Chitinophagaceae bacterium]
MRIKIISGIILLLWMQYSAIAQNKVENIIVVTTDGLRWQELFTGMDTALANNPLYNQHQKDYIYKTYWHADEKERRKKLLPFIWSSFVASGQLYGSRAYQNFVNTANPYWFSYPGYNEMFAGFVDSAINTNSYPDNPNLNVLEFLNSQPGYRGKVAAFGSWEAYDRILRKKTAGYPVIAAFDNIDWKDATYAEKLINQMKQNSYKAEEEFGCMDVFTHFQAMEYLKTRKPKVLYVAYLETDEWAHSKMYRSYLDAAHHVDQWLKQLWDFVQSQPAYRNKTALVITTDHGRGDTNKAEWTSHGSKIVGADQIWFGVMAPGIPAKGEVTTPVQLYQKQIAQTIASLLGKKFTANHPVAPVIVLVNEK